MKVSYVGQKLSLKRLKVENEQLLQKCSILQKEVDTLKKRLDRKEIALLKKL